MDLTFPADPARLSDAREALRQWLTDCGLDARRAYDILLATDEACANAIEHGCRDRDDGIVRLRAAVEDGALRILVSDNGRWDPPAAQQDDYRGRGLQLMRSLMDQLDVRTGTEGTTVELRVGLAAAEPQATDSRDSAAR
ncbi:ATP-binding protein [Nocardia sp. NPDC050712]|uniref:ATP-binding protein n=1 Tax=Nocardia sp. NPDC050712 TaxID=3155518 RepID=UPI0033D71F61